MVFKPVDRKFDPLKDFLAPATVRHFLGRQIWMSVDRRTAKRFLVFNQPGV